MSTTDIRSLLTTLESLDAQPLDEVNWQQAGEIAKRTAQISPMLALSILDADNLDPVVMPELTGADYSAPAEPEYMTKMPQAPVAQKTRVGGWYPVFFDKYSVEKIDTIADNMNTGKISSISVTYDNSEALAKKIAKNLSIMTGEDIQTQHVPQQDTADVKYDHDNVAVFVKQ